MGIDAMMHARVSGPLPDLELRQAPSVLHAAFPGELYVSAPDRHCLTQRFEEEL